MKLSQIKSISSKTTKIAKKILVAEDSPYTQLPFKFPMGYKRVYIPKANTKELRPLGVPQPQGRLFLHLFTNFLYIYLESTFKPTQHGFIPERGTLSAGKQFFTQELGKYKYIYEIDLRKCFDKLDHYYISKKLAEAGVPDDIRAMIIRLNASQPKFNEMKMDESKHFTQSTLSLLLDRDHYFTSEGVAQGSSFGPLLAAFALQEFFSQAKSLSYADDALFFSNKLIKLTTPENSGIEINTEKSGYVKYNGEGIKPFIFLGLRFNGQKLSAKTRKGSTLVLSDRLATSLQAIEYLENTQKPTIQQSPGDQLHEIEEISDNWTTIMKGRIAGYIMSRLYIGEWNPSTTRQNFALNYREASGTSIYPRIKDIDLGRIKITNVSTFAYESLFHILRGNSGVIDFDRYFPDTFKEKLTRHYEESSKIIKTEISKGSNTIQRSLQKKGFAISKYYKRKKSGR